MGVNRLNPVQKATHFLKNKKCTVTVKTATDQRPQASCNISTHQCSQSRKMDRNAKLTAASGTTNIHQQSSPLSYHKYREIHYNIG